ncbi:MAG: penicillin acylase family protein [Acidithiobacillales bacterium]
MRRALSVLLPALGLVAISSLPASPLEARPPGPAGFLKLPGMQAGGTIERDASGIAHIGAMTTHDLFFLNGWQHAEDRLFQMDVTRRQASGTLAELVGPGALSSDVQLRTLGLRRAAAASLPVLSRRTRDALDAYAAGVNAWVSSHPLPPEYAALHLTKFVPWTALDSVACAKVLAFGLSFSTDDITTTTALLSYQAAGAAAGFDGTKLFFDDLFRSAPFDPMTTLPPRAAALAGAPEAARMAGAPVEAKVPRELVASAAARGGELLSRGVLALAQSYLAKIEEAPYFKKLLAPPGERGSNQWVVAGSHTTTGSPILASDPHLALGTPSTLYPIALRSGRLDAVGYGFAGVPLIVIGANRRITWGATVNPLDVTDIFAEEVVPDPSSPSGLSTIYKGQPEHVIPIPESYLVNVSTAASPDTLVPPPPGSVPDATLIVPRRNGGPIISLNMAAGSALSVQYTGFSPTREIDCFYAWDVAENLRQFEDGLHFFDFGSQNWTYADVQGNIAYFTSAKDPLREDLEAGAPVGLPPWFIRNGTGENEWIRLPRPEPGETIPYELLPFSEMPQAVNPSWGYAINANNDPDGVTLTNNPLGRTRPSGGLYYLDAYYDGYRGGRILQRITQALAGGGKISPEGMRDIQADIVPVDAQFFVPYIVKAYDDALAPGANPALAALASDPGVGEAAGRLRSWDLSFPTGLTEGWDAGKPSGTPPSAGQVDASVAATIYATWRSRFVSDVIDAPLGAISPSLPTPPGPLALSALRNLLERLPTTGGIGASGFPFFSVPGVTSPDVRRDLYVLTSLREALDLLAGPAFEPAFGGSTNQDDYRWGKLHRIVFAHILDGPFSIPPAGGAFPAPLPGLPGIPRSGGFGTVDVGSFDVRAHSSSGFMFGSGPTRRWVADMTRHGPNVVSSLPGGVSGVLGSPLYFNLLPMWLVNGVFEFEFAKGPPFGPMN